MTSHFDYSPARYIERQRQLRKSFQEMQDAPAEATVLFGGDFNLTDFVVRNASLCLLNGCIVHRN